MEDESLSSTEQNSIFSLTLEEFQLKTGRNFGSMNMDELLNSIWNMDGQQQGHLSNLNQNEGEILVDGPIFPGQGSFHIPTPLCNKTVEEVWAEIQRSQSFQENHPDFIHNGVLGTQLTFGEMTLEDFLVKVGALHGASADILSSSQLIVAALTNTSMNFSSNNGSFDTSIVITDQPMMDVEFSQTNNGTGGGVLAGNASNSMYPMFVPTNGSYIGESSKAAIGNGSSGSRTKRRSTMASCSTEVAIERRQRRMIKNRESAARSRARKQAYTAELEIELNQVREENTKLRLIVEEAENKKREEEMNENSSPNQQAGGMEKLKAIRRTASTSW